MYVDDTPAVVDVPHNGDGTEGVMAE